MDVLKKLFSFLVCITYVLGAIGGTAYLFYFKEPLFAVAILAICAMAFPYVKAKFKRLLEA